MRVFVFRLLATVLVTLAAERAHAQAIAPPHLTIPTVSRPPTLADFVAMEVSESPAGMRRIEGFVQRFPNDGEPVTERTVVYVGYDSQTFYVAFQCFDREPERIGAHVVPRDAFPNDEDTVAVHIDTFRDLKHAYGFQVNAHGVQTDGTYTEGAGWDLSWDAVWHADGARTAQGFVVLYSIPFRSLRFPSSDRQQWGMFFYRGIGRKAEQVYWPPCSTRMAARFPQAAVVDGIAHVSPGRNIQAIPYVAGRSFRTLDSTDGRRAFVSDLADTSTGLDAKVVVRDSIVVDATVNPDFSQVESDQPQITVNKPFEVFFPEKRPFFLENAMYFTTPIQLLFTRRIANPLIGGRATGRAGAYSLGAMVVDDRAAIAATGEKAWFGVARVMRDVGRESYVGAFASQRSAGSASNTVGALDGRVKLGRNWMATGQGVVTDTNGAGLRSRSGSAMFASLVGGGRRFNYELDYNDRSAAFRAVDGFVPRVDIRSIDQTYSFRARPTTGAVQAWGPDLVVNRTWDHRGRPLDWSVTPRFDLQWPATTILDMYYTAAHQALRPGEVPSVSEIVDTEASRAGVSFQSAALPRIIGSGTFFAGDAVNLTPSPASVALSGQTAPAGRIADATTSATVRLSSSLMLDVSYLFDRLRDSASGRVVYSNRIVRFRLGEQFTRALALRAIVQYTSLATDAAETTLPPDRGLNYDLLLTYLRRPGTALYVGANYNLANIDPAFAASPLGLKRSGTLHNTGWQVFTKMSYLIRR